MILIPSRPPVSRTERIWGLGWRVRGVFGVGKVEDCGEFSVDYNHKQENDEDSQTRTWNEGVIKYLRKLKCLLS